MTPLCTCGTAVLVARSNDDCETCNEKAEHKRKQPVHLFVGAFELLPDEHAPDCGNHGSALAESIADSRTCLAGSDVTESGTETPDGSAEHAYEVGFGITVEILPVRYRLADEGLLHDNGVDDEVAEEHSERENDDSGVRCTHARCGVCEISEVHRPHHE